MQTDRDLSRIPFALSGAYAIYLVMTPPHGSAPLHERRKAEGVDVERVAPAFAILAKVGHESARASFISMYLVEVLAILELLPSSEVPALMLTVPYLTSWCILVCGAAIRVWCYRTMAQFFTFELSIRQHHKLVTHGPYALVRHPSYTGALLAVLGCLGCCSWVFRVFLVFLDLNASADGWATNLYWAAVTMFVTAIVLGAVGPRMKKEDKMLKEAFGPEWEAWKRNVPYKLIPGVY